MKKIVFLIDNLKGGGAEKAIKIIVDGLYDKAYNPIVILLENKKDYQVKDGIEIYALSENITKYNFIFLYFKLLKLLKKLSPDILYATNTKAQILSLLTKKFFKTKRIINIQVDLKKQYEDRLYILDFFTKLLKNADEYSFISYGIYDSLKYVIPAKNNIFISNAIDFDEIDSLKKESLEDEYQEMFSKKTFITIGRLTKQKGQVTLLKAFAKINYDVNLIIIGSGEKEYELKKLAMELKIDDRVYFLGFVKNPFKFLYNANIFVLSSLWEGFGNVIVEAMRCELPIISSDCPSGPREILAPKSDIFNYLEDENELCEYGILSVLNSTTHLEKAMCRVLNDALLQKKYKEKSILRALDYSKEIIVENFIDKVMR